MSEKKTMVLTGDGLVEKLRVAAMIISRRETGDRSSPILAVFNEKWGAFTLPMSKVRIWESARRSEMTEPPQRNALRPVANKDRTGERPKDAAIRAAAECMGRSFTRTGDSDIEPLGVLSAEPFLSARSMQVKDYDIEVFRVRVEPGAEPKGLGVAQWWPVDYFLDPDRQPISETARYIITSLRGRKQL